MELDLPAQESAKRPPWSHYLWVIVASALAHLWCLGSQFYMDDLTAIINNQLVREGTFWKAGVLSMWTTFGYVVQYRCFGMSAVGFHAVNWLLHTATACVLLGLACTFIRGRMAIGVAWFAALLFAVHPLASEIPNYARTQDLAWVTLFSLTASWMVLIWLRQGGWKFAVASVLCILGATMSKGPGGFHALMMTVMVGLAAMESSHWAALRRRAWWLPVIVILGITAFWFSGESGRFWKATEMWNDPRFIGHGYTLTRVFWEFASRAVVPVHLCSDHQIAETLVPPGSSWWHVPDTMAMVSAAAMVSLTIFSLWLCWLQKTRLFGVCLFLFVATILFRVLYLIPEFMPEYRIYPGMPWFCLGIAIFATTCWKRTACWMRITHVSAVIPAMLTITTLVALSAKRSFDWHHLDRLCADVLHQYPAQARALWELQDRDTTAGDWQKIITRQQREWNPILQQFLKQNRQLAPQRELPSGNFALADVGCKARYALAVAHLRGATAGMLEINQLERYMDQLHIDQRIHRSYLMTAKILVLEQAGNHRAALDLINNKDIPNNLTPTEIQRIKSKAN